jgi:N,N-dimethylformamidase
MQVVGYLDRLTARPGEHIDCHVSVSESRDVHVDLVRLIHGDENPAGPGFKIEEVRRVDRTTVRVSPQPTYPGSCMVAEGVWEAAPQSLTLEVHVWPTTPECGRHQGLISLRGANGDMLALALGVDGRLELITGSAGVETRCATVERLATRTWYRIAASIDTAAGTASIAVLELASGTESVTAAATALSLPDDADCVVGALSCRRSSRGQAVPEHCFNGKLERPRLVEGTMPEGQALADWSFELGMDGDAVTDVSGRNRNGRLINRPARAMTGKDWTGSELSHRYAPEHYASVHFHEDDLDDAGWERGVRITLPEDLGSAVYAVRLRTGSATDHVPFCVAPPVEYARSPITLLLPTFTYLAYANERLVEREPHSIALGSHDRTVAEHPEFGLSLYDRHIDGSGVCYASSLRPLLNVRPDYRSWMHDAPRHLSADLSIVDWLEHVGVPYDVVTDHDLHRDGLAALGDSRVVVTGTHPEYVSAQMLDALQSHLAGGGKLMYLGGNGFYWVTSQDLRRPNVIEVRRGVAGTRTWESEPGETFHSTTGEPGGLWRHRGRPPNALAGIGFSAMLTGVRSAGVRDELKAPGYRRLPDSFRPEVAFAFEGIADDEIIGDFGLVMDGASGDEIDRYDVDRGSPRNAYVLARSTGHSDLYLLCSEDIPMTSTRVDGTSSDLVRSDVVLLDLPGGGAVFSVGSISFAGSLSHDNYENNVAQLTTNVLTEFLRG